jgi:hypothetical protein
MMPGMTLCTAILAGERIPQRRIMRLRRGRRPPTQPGHHVEVLCRLAQALPTMKSRAGAPTPCSLAQRDAVGETTRHHPIRPRCAVAPPDRYTRRPPTPPRRALVPSPLWGSVQPLRGSPGRR